VPVLTCPAAVLLRGSVPQAFYRDCPKLDAVSGQCLTCPPHYPPEATGEGLQMEESDGKHARACPAAAPLLRSVPRAPQRGCPPLLVVNSVLSPMSPPPTHSSTLLKPLGKGCKWGILTGGIRGAGKRGVIGAAARRVGHNVATSLGAGAGIVEAGRDLRSTESSSRSRVQAKSIGAGAAEASRSEVRARGS
jgi:hypothetical protein